MQLRVTVQGFGRRRDLLVPATTPVVQLLPALAHALGGEALPGHGLAAVGGPALEPGRSLAEGGVYDGHVLYLVDAADWRPPLVAAAAAEGGRAGPGRWNREATAGVLAGAGVLTLLALAGFAARAGALGAGAGLLALLAVAGLMASAMTLRLPPLVRWALVCGGWVLAWPGGWWAAGAPAGTAGLAAPALAATLASLAALPDLPEIAPGAAVATGALAGGTAAVAAGGRNPAVAAVVVVVGVVLIRLLTPLCSSLLAAVTGSMADQDAIATAARRCRTLMASVAAGLAVTSAGAAAVLVAGGGAAALGLAAVAALALALHARSFHFAMDVLPPAAAAVAILVAILAALGPPPLVVAGLAAAALAAVWRRLPALPAPPRAAWLVVDLLLAPLALAELGVFDAVVQAVRHVLH